MPYTYYIIIGIIEISLIFKEVVLRARFGNVDKMIGDVDWLTFDRHAVVVKILARSDIHTAIHLSRVGRDNLCTHLAVNEWQ